jgi:ApaG protein
VPAAPFYHSITAGIRITVRPSFLTDQSRPALGHFVFGYAVRIENVSPIAVRLTHRHWRIHDSIGGGEDQEIQGEGVVGEQPHIAPGSVYEYQSYCVLKSPSGSMEGAYRFERPDGTAFAARIPRFALDAGAEAGR